MMPHNHHHTRYNKQHSPYQLLTFQSSENYVLTKVSSCLCLNPPEHQCPDNVNIRCIFKLYELLQTL